MHIYLMSEQTDSSLRDTPKRSGSFEEKWHTFLIRLSKASLNMLPIPLIKKLIYVFTTK